VKRVYLDQAEWIELARARLGKPTSEGAREVLDIARAGVPLGLVAFPLSGVHYMENAKTHRWRQRGALAATMAELSCFATIAPASRLLEGELDQALRKMFGRPYEVRPIDAFGTGGAHAFGEPELADVEDRRLRALMDTDPALRPFIEQRREFAMLAGPPMDFPRPWFPMESVRQQEERFATTQRQVGATLRDAGYGNDGRAVPTLVAQMLVEILDPLNKAMAKTGLSADLLDTPEALTELLMDLPTQRVDYELRLAMHRDAGLPWKGNDLDDIGALWLSVPYCDVVVTERKWRALVQTTHLDKLYGTTVLDSLADLPALLVA
jgi:hypothetical protein